MNRRMARPPGKKKPPLGKTAAWHSQRDVASGEFDPGDRNLAGPRIVARVEPHLLAFVQSGNAGALQRGGMNEDVLLSVIGLNEAEAFLAVVELYRTWG